MLILDHSLLERFLPHGSLNISFHHERCLLLLSVRGISFTWLLTDRLANALTFQIDFLLPYIVQYVSISHHVLLIHQGMVENIVSLRH